MLAVVTVLFAVAGREAPGQATSPVAFRTRLRHAVRLRTAQDLADLYAITFGGFLAFGVSLAALSLAFEPPIVLATLTL